MKDHNMNAEKYLDIKPEVAKALRKGQPVVALESTILRHRAFVLKMT